jgi:hypothetical protein
MKLNIRTLCASAAALAATLMISGCFKLPEIPVINGPYIQVYYDGHIECMVANMDDSGPVIYFELFGTEDNPIVSYSTSSQGDKKAVYDSLCNKHSDYGYHGEDRYANEPLKKCYAKDIVSFDVVSNSDFDKNHPAGSSLKDIIVFDGYSPYRWIKSGYSGEPYFTHTRTTADKVVEDDLKLLCAIQLFTLRFSTIPTNSSAHTLTITLVTDDGKSHVYERQVFF